MTRTTKDVLALARKHVADNAETEASARVCLADAVILYDGGEWSAARERALRSLKYSVGVLHQAYRQAAQ
jgi:hypothetical protein